MFNKVVETSGVTFSKWDAIALFYIDLKPFLRFIRRLQYILYIIFATQQ